MGGAWQQGPEWGPPCSASHLCIQSAAHTILSGAAVSPLQPAWPWKDWRGVHRLPPLPTRHLACSALTPFPLSCAGVRHWSSPEGRVSRGTCEQRAPPCVPRKAPLPSRPHCFSPSLPHGRFLPADQHTPCHLALGGTSCPSSLGGAHFRETDSKAPHFLLRVQTRPPATRAASATQCVPGAPRPGSRTLPPPCPGQPPALPTDSSRFCT